MSAVMDGGDLVFRIVFDDSKLPPAAKKVQQGIKDLGEEGKKAAGHMEKFSVANAGATRELLVLAHELSQGNYKRFGGSLLVLAERTNAMSLLFNGWALAAGGVAVALGGLGYAVEHGQQQQSKLNQALQLTGNFAGQTVGSIDVLARSVSSIDHRPIGDAREALQSLVASAAFGPQSLPVAAQAVVNLQKFTGQSSDEIVKDFAAMRGGVAKWAAEHNKSYAFLTLDVYQHIRSLEAQGKADEASAVALGALNDKLASTPQHLGAIDRLLQSGKKTWSEWWDAALNIGRGETLEQKLGAVQAQLDGASGRRSSSGQSARGPLQDRGLDLSRQIFREQERAAEQAAITAKNQKEIEEHSEAFQQTLAAIDKGGYDLRAAIGDRARGDELLKLDRQFDQLEISQEKYRAKREELARADMKAKIDQVDFEISQETRRPVGTESERNQQRGRILEFEAKRIGLLKQRDQLEERIRRGELAGKPRDVLEDAATAFRRLEIPQGDSIDKALDARREAVAGGTHELIQQTRGINVALIKDDRARAEAQFQIEYEQERKRLDLGALSASDRKTAEAALADWRIARERQITEELKPEYQKQLELFADTTRYAKQASDEFHKGFIDTGRNAFVEWVKTGKLSASSLVDFIKERFATIAYDRFLAKPIDAFAGSIFDGFASLIGLHHDGGIAGQATSSRRVSALAFAGAPRYHMGGVAGDEVPAILRRGEEVLTRQDPRHVANGGRAPSIAIDASIGSIGAGVSRAEMYAAQAQQRRWVETRLARLQTLGRLS